MPDFSRRWCFAIREYSRDEHGYIPGVVFENEPGFYPLAGNGPCAQPWYWGTTREEADRACAHANAEAGISPEEAARIEESARLASTAVSVENH
jgi:hypothetical protein